MDAANDDPIAEAQEIGVLRALLESPRAESSSTSERSNRGFRDELTVVHRRGVSPDSAATLASELQTDDVARRRSTLRSLVDRKVDMALAAVASSALSDRDFEVRSLALDVLERAPHLVPVDSLASILRGDTAELRARALVLLGKNGNARVIEELEAATAEDEPAVIAASLEGTTAFLQAAVGIQADDPAIERIAAAVGALAPDGLRRFSSRLASLAHLIHRPAIEARLRSPDGRVRAGAALLALAAPSMNLRGAVEQLVRDDDPTVRQLGRAAAGRMHDEDEEVRAPLGVAAEVPAAEVPPAGSLDALIEGLQRTLDRSHLLRRLEAVSGRQWLEVQLRSASPDQLVRVTSLLSGDASPELAASVGRAAVVQLGGEALEEVSRALRQVPGLAETLAAWRVDADTPRRDDALRIAGLVEPGAELFEEGLSHPDADHRLAAIQEVGDHVGGFVAMRLISVLQRDTSERVRLAAVTVLHRAKREHRLAAAEAAISAPDSEVRRQAVRLVVGETSEELAVLARYLHDPDVEVCRVASGYLATHRGPAGLALLWGALRTAPPASREVLLDALLRFDVEAVRLLADQASDSPVPIERSTAVALLARLGGTASEPALVRGLTDPDPVVRTEALQALGDRVAPATLDEVVGRLRDPDAAVRAAAVRALADKEDDRAIPGIIERLGDAEGKVKDLAAEAVLMRRSVWVAEQLVEALRSPGRRGAAASLLAAMPEESFDVLVSAAQGGDADVVHAVGEALASSGAEPRLLQELNDVRPATRVRAALALGAMRSTDAVPELCRRLQDPDPEVRSAVAKVLGELDDDQALDPLNQAFSSDPDPEVAAAIERAIRQLETETPR